LSYKNIFLSLLSGLLLILCFPQFNLSFLAWIALVPLLLALYSLSSTSSKDLLGKSFILGLLTGVVFYGGLLYWVISIRRVSPLGIPAWLLLSVFQALYLALFSLITSFFYSLSSFPASAERRSADRPSREDRQTLPSLSAGNAQAGKGQAAEMPSFAQVFFPAFLWVVIEYYRGRGFWGFPWGSLCYSQYLNIPLIQISEWTGMEGVSFLIVLVNSVVSYQLLVIGRKERQRSPHRRPTEEARSYLPLGVIALLLIVSFAYGILIKSNPLPSPKIKVAVIQGNTPRDLAWSANYRDYTLDVYQRLSLKAKKKNPQMIIWPESVIAWGDLRDFYLLYRLRKLAREVKTHLLLGCFDSNERKEDFNAAVVFSPQGEILGKYYKMHLVPFGEVVPFKGFFKLINYNPWEGWKDLTPGQEYSVIKTNLGNLGFNICYETTFPYISRQTVRRGAQLIIGLVTDSWYRKVTTYQHTSMFPFRAVENRRYLIRAADTGVSCIIDPYGRIIKKTPPFVEKILTGYVDLRERKTLYTKYGDWFIFLSLLGIIFYLTSITCSLIKRGKIPPLDSI